MMGYSNWNIEEYENLLPWNPAKNGLKYLYDYDRKTASHMLESDEWTKAVFVREPKDRFLSAYLDKAFHPTYLMDKCCWEQPQGCVENARASAQGFLNLIKFCSDAHWNPLYKRMEPKYWKYLNFVGHMETLEQDAKRLLIKIGAWDKYGKSGFGDDGKESFFFDSSSVKHATNATQKLKSYLSTELVTELEDFYAPDYKIDAFNITKLVV
jgi:hypothetical protein